MNYDSAKAFILNKLEKELPSALCYHNLEHTLDVEKAVIIYAKQEHIEIDQVVLLKTAALFHDSGFIYQYLHNEPLGAQIAEQTLPLFDYNSHQIDIVKELILATSIKYSPKNRLEEIIRDADLDYLGRDDFFQKSENLKHEFYHQKMFEQENEWDKLQLDFMKNHKYHTHSAISNREAKKQENIKKLEQKLLF